MNLFSQLVDKTQNILPKDGSVNYYGVIMPPANADDFLFLLLRDIHWRNDRAKIYGREIVTKRKVAWYGDKAFKYSYSNTEKTAAPWTGDLLKLKKIVEKETGETFNSCLLNLYHNGDEGMAWHSDGETDLKKNGAIASMSFGAERKFCFKHKKSKDTTSLILEHGSLLVMKDETQTYWLHRLPPTKKIDQPRVNLTFRTIIERDVPNSITLGR